MRRSLPALALWHHLGYTRCLPWSLKLRVEMDGVLGSQEQVVMTKNVNRENHGARVTCAAGGVVATGFVGGFWMLGL